MHQHPRHLGLLALLLFSVAVATACHAAPHTFQFDPDDYAVTPRQTVTVAGSFNGWSKDALPMQRGDDGVYRVAVELPDGIHLYKFVVDGEHWVEDTVHGDPALRDPDGHGGMNSAVLIGPDARRLPPPQPDHIRVDAVRFDPAQDVTIISENAVMVRLATQADDVSAVEAHITGPDAEPRVLPLTKVESRLGRDHYAGLLTVPGGRLHYELVLRDGDAEHRITPPGQPLLLAPTFLTPDWAKDATWYQVFVERFRNGAESNDPGDAWYENRLPWTIDWWKTYPEHGEARGARNFYLGEGNVWKRRFGGDLQGLRQKLPYLRTLGVNALYLNPIFEADSMHKYDTSDFRHVDDNFGVKGDLPIPGETDDPATWQWSPSDRLFLAFLDEAHDQGFRVIIDGVFNHVGRSHPFFQHVLAHGPDSRYADWFEITDWGDPTNWRPMDDPMAVHGKPGGIQWRAWDGDNGHLPTFQKHPELGLAPGPRQHIFDITERWLAPDGDPTRGVDGFRLDMPGDIPHPFWIDWRRHVKRIKPDAYITGEIWSFAQPWLGGDQFDATMNYPFAMAIHDFLVNRRTAISPNAFGQRLMEIAYAYPLQVALVQQNLIGSHDTDRLASMMVNPDRSYDGQNRIQDSGPDYDPQRPTDRQWQRVMLAVTSQMTFMGAPMVYYGDEAGMWSPDDPSNRMPMVWPDLMPYEDPAVTFHRGVFEHHQRLIAIRDALRPLRRGLFHVLHTDDPRGILVYARELDDARVIIALNRSGETQTITIALPDGAVQALVDVLDDAAAEVIPPDDAPDARPTLRLRDDAPTLSAQDGRLELTLDPLGAAILVPREALP